MPKLTYTVYGLVEGDALLTKPELSCDANLDQKGKYEITVSGADAGSDYRISYEAGTLTVSSEDYPFVPTPRPDPKPSTPQWVQDGNGWKYQNASGSYLKDQWKYLSSDRGTSAWYWFGEAGYAATGWQQIKGTLNSRGEMQTGWKLVDGSWYYLKSWDGMATGWQLLDGKWYYFYESGVMAVSTMTPDGFYVNASGEWVS